MKTFDFGPRAHTLPEPEAALARLHGKLRPDHMENRSGGRIVALDRHTFIRWWPPSYWEEEMQGAPEGRYDLIDFTQRHLSALERESDGTVRVASHRSFVAAHPLQPEASAIMSVVEFCPGDKVNLSNSRRNNADDPRHAKSVYGSVRYLGWVVGEGLTQYLWDTPAPHQYLLAKGNAPNPLVDTDQNVGPVDDSEYGFGRTLSNLNSWAYDLRKVSELAVRSLAIIEDIQASRSSR